MAFLRSGPFRSDQEHDEAAFPNDFEVHFDNNSRAETKFPGTGQEALVKTGNGTRFSGRSLGLRWLLVLMVLNGTMLSWGIYSILDSKQAYQEKARLTTQNMARLLDQSVSSSVSKIDLTLLSVVDELENQLRDRGHLDASQSNAFLLAHQKRLTELSSLRVADASGRVILGKGVSSSTQASWADRDFFSALRVRNDLGMVVTNPIFGRLNQTWIISLVRRFNKPDGSFAGVVSAAVPLTYLGTLLSAMDVGPKGIALLCDANLGVIARHPALNAPSSVVGAKVFSQEWDDGLPSGQHDFTFHSKGMADGVERTNTYRKITGAPFHIVVGLGSEDYLAAWMLAAQRTMASVAIFVLVTCGFGWQLWRSQIKSRQAAAERDRSLLLLQKIASRVPGMVYQFLLRPDGSSCVPYSNDAIRDIFRVSPEEVREDASKAFANLHPDDHDRVVASIDQSARNLTPWFLESRVKFADGTVRWLLGNALPDREEDGAVLWHGFITDVTELKRSERAMRESQALAREVLNSVQEHIAVIDETGTILTVNEAWRQFSRENSPEPGQLAPATDVGTNYLQVCRNAGGDGFAVCDGIQSVLDGRLPSFHLEYPCHTPGEQRWFSMNVSSLGFGKEGAVITHIDITLRKQSEEVLQRQSQALARSNAELEQFAYVASHDLRQPLRMVNSYVQLLERALADKLDDNTREMMHFAADGARRMDQMLVSLLEYSRVGRKGQPLLALDSRAAVDEALHFLEPAIAQAQASVRVSGEWPQVLASRDEFTRLWQNLIDNAVKYRVPERLPKIDITVTPEPEGDGWRFCVADNGIGIDPAQFDRLFKVFQRLNTRDQFEGNGIGLAVARKIVERHGGRIWVESGGAGLGSRFFFFLPARLPMENTP